MNPWSARVSILSVGVALALGLTLLPPPAPFILDDDTNLMSVLALREGGFEVPGTSKLGASEELFWFDPRGYGRGAEARPVTTLPPMYAPVALPFLALGGWRGLVFLQALSFVGCVGLLFWLARRRLGRGKLAWLALPVAFFGAYLLEYAMGVWPQMLSMLLTTAAFACATERLGMSSTARWRLAAGGLAGLAVGVRYQNIVYAGALGVGIVLLSPWRVIEGAAFGVGLAGPLTLAATINYQRLGVFNPITKGASYLQAAYPESRLASSAWALVSRLADASMVPTWALKGQPWWHVDQDSGALLHLRALKKALLQSVPWALLPLVVAARSWWPRRGEGELTPLLRQQRSDLRVMALVIAFVVCVIVSFGVRRHEGISFNQRYFIDLLPLLVHGLLITLDQLEEAPSLRPVLIGAGLGLGLWGALHLGLDLLSTARLLALLRLPLVLGVLLLGAWLLRQRFSGALALVLGLCLSWAAVVHVSGDLVTSFATRAQRYAEGRALAKELPRGERLGIFAYWGKKDCLGPLLLSHDLVVADPYYDKGASAPRLVREMLRDGRRVFVIANGHSLELFKKMSAGLTAKAKLLPLAHLPRPLLLVELSSP